MLNEAGRADLQMAHNEFIYVGESDAQVKADVRDHVLWYVRTAAKIWGERDKDKVAEQFANYTEILEFSKLFLSTIFTTSWVYSAHPTRWPTRLSG